MRIDPEYAYVVGYVDGYTKGTNATPYEKAEMVHALYDYCLSEDEWSFRLDEMPFDLFNDITDWC